MSRPRVFPLAGEPVTANLPVMERNCTHYEGELVGDQVILTSIRYPSEFVNENGEVVMTCEPVELDVDPKFCSPAEASLLGAR